MYTAYKVNIDGNLTNKEHLNNQHEINDWMWRAYDNGVPTVRVQKDTTGQFAIFTDNGEQYVRVANVDPG
tara:strand:- start:2509 stop:2718 length:210 start_codon:yes stop_codon:yes gene_type:complete